MPKISDLPAAVTLELTDEAAYNQSGVTRRGSVSQIPAAIDGLIDHTAILNVGVNTHSNIDAHIADLANPHVVTKTQVGLSDVENILDNLSAVVPPTVNDDNTAGYSIGSVWIDTATGITYIATDVTTGVAMWGVMTGTQKGRFVINMANNISTTYSPYATTSVTTNASGYFGWVVPSDFLSIDECLVYAFAASTVVGMDIDLLLNNSAPGEPYNTNSASNVSSTYDSVATETFTLDATSLFSAVNPGDAVGLQVQHNTIGQTVGYPALVFKYNRT